jgi:hypothetical protein
MDTAERLLLAETVRDALSAATANADAVLADLGWLDMLESEPSDAIDIVFRALGEANAVATVLDDVVCTALGLPPRPDLGVVMPPFASWAAPGAVEDGRVRARGITSSRAAGASELLVVSTSGAGLHAVVVPARAAALTALHGIDADAGLYLVDVDADFHDDARRNGAIDGPAWDAAVALARRALGYQTSGAARAMLDLARTHALDRVQFGRPVARFQAVRHRLAEALVAIESLDATLSAARDEPGSETAALAKAVAGRSARIVATHCQQVLAGIGFTTDHPFHRYLKRTMLLDGLFGAADDIVVAIGADLIASGTVPTLIDL